MKEAKPLINVLLDARKLGDGGIGVYIENLVNGFLALPPRHTKRFGLSLLVPELDQAQISPKKAEWLRSLFDKWTPEVKLIPEVSRKYSLEEYLLLARRQRETLQQMTIFHSPHYTLPFFLNLPTVVTIHDIIHVTHPDTRWHKLIGKALIGSALKRADHIITVSKASKQRIIETFGETSAPISVVPNAQQTGMHRASENEIQSYCESNYLTRPYYVFVGSDRPHKGFQTLYQAWAMFVERCKRNGDHLPILVAIGDRYSPQTKAEIFSLGLSSAVHFIEHVTPEELSILYSGAEAVVIPSREEGFGLMAIEALSCNTRIVASPVPSIKEICGRLVFFAEDFGAEALYRAIVDCCEDQKKDKRINDGQKKASKFSIESTTRKTLWVYQELVRRFSETSVALEAFSSYNRDDNSQNSADDSNCKLCSNG